MIYWVYCDYSLLEAPWSKLLALLDLFIEYILLGHPFPQFLTKHFLKQDWEVQSSGYSSSHDSCTVVTIEFRLTLAKFSPKNTKVHTKIRPF